MTTIRTCFVEDCSNEEAVSLTINGNEQPVCEKCIMQLLNVLGDNPSVVTGLRVEGDDQDGNELTLLMGDMVVENEND